MLLGAIFIKGSFIVSGVLTAKSFFDNTGVSAVTGLDFVTGSLVVVATVLFLSARLGSFFVLVTEGVKDFELFFTTELLKPGKLFFNARLLSVVRPKPQLPSWLGAGIQLPSRVSSPPFILKKISLCT